MLKLNELCHDIIDCEHKTAPTQENGYLLIRTVNIGEGRLLLDGVKKVSTEIYAEWTKRATPKPGDLILAREAPVGNVCIIPENLKVCLGQRTVLIKVDKSKADPRYLMYLLLGNAVQKWFKLLSAGATVAHLNVGDIRELELPQLHSLNEQRKIADILSAWDEAINLTEQLIAAKQKRKQALMQRLLTGQVRFPEFKEEWAEFQLGSLANLTAGGTPSTIVRDYWDGNIRWMNSGEINLRYIYEVEGRITQLGLDNSSAKLIPPNSVMIALAGQGKTRGMVAVNKVETATNQSIAAIIPDSSKLDYLYLFFNLDNRYDEMRLLSGGNGGRGGLNLTILKNVVIRLPTLQEQRKIAEVLSACDIELNLLQQKLAALRQQKKGLMQQLLTGKIRVKV